MQPATIRINTQDSEKKIYNQENVGETLMIHPGVGRSGWTISVRESGIALVNYVRTREQARKIAKSLDKKVQELRSACMIAQIVASA